MKLSNPLRIWAGSVGLLLVLTFVTVGCKDKGITDPGNNPNNPPPGNDDSDLLETIQSNSNLTTLTALMEGTTLPAILSGSGTKTVFAPSDAAFASLEKDYLEALTSQQKLDLLNYHIYNGSYSVINEIKRETIASLHGDPLFIEIGQSFGNLVNNQATFDSTNIEATNGLVHIVDKVLVPDELGTLADNIRKRYAYRKFYERMESAGLVELLQESGTKTLLTTSDTALEWYEVSEGMTFTEEQWKEVMQYHILELDLTVAGPGTRTALVTLSGDSVYLTIDEPGQYLVNGGGGSPVKVIKATNGKIVYPSGIMLPDKYIGVLPILDKRFDFRTARAAMAIAKMTGRLYNSINNADETFTLFIPRDDAEGINSLPDDEDGLANIFKYHVLLEDITSDRLQHNQSYTTWQGGQITVTKSGDEIIINGTARIKQADLIGKNGVVHVIDRVLIPPAN